MEELGRLAHLLFDDARHENSVYMEGMIDQSILLQHNNEWYS